MRFEDMLRKAQQQYNRLLRKVVKFREEATVLRRQLEDLRLSISQARDVQLILNLKSSRNRAIQEAQRMSVELRDLRYLAIERESAQEVFITSRDCPTGGFEAIWAHKEYPGCDARALLINIRPIVPIVVAMEADDGDEE